MSCKRFSLKIWRQPADLKCRLGRIADPSMRFGVLGSVIGKRSFPPTGMGRLAAFAVNRVCDWRRERRE
jgi:hypothetical protein